MRSPPSDDLRRAAEIVNEGARVAILVGQGALGARGQVAQVVELLQAGVAKALLGKAVLPDTLPYVTGAIGMLGTKPSWQMMQRCDTLLTVGSSMPYSEFLPKEGSARGIQIDIDPRMLGIRYPYEVNLAGDSAATLEALMPLLEPKLDGSWREQVEEWVRDWWEIVEARAMNEADPINGQRVFWELSDQLPDGVMITCDCGSATGWYARDVKLREGMFGSTSGTLATMGSALPYAIAAKFAHPDRPCVALLGDGAMQMDGVNELITVAKYWRRWSDPRLIVLILNNRDLSYVSWEQRAMAGDIRFEASQELPDVRYAEWAKLLGLGGIRIERPEDVAGAWTDAFGFDRPFVLEAIVDTNVPPLPPHVTLEQATAMTRALLEGRPGPRRDHPPDLPRPDRGLRSASTLTRALGASRLLREQDTSPASGHSPAIGLRLVTSTWETRSQAYPYLEKSERFMGGLDGDGNSEPYPSTDPDRDVEGRPGALHRRVLGQAHGDRERAREVHGVRGHARGQGEPCRLTGLRDGQGRLDRHQ